MPRISTPPNNVTKVAPAPASGAAHRGRPLDRRRIVPPTSILGSKWTHRDHESGWRHFHVITHERRPEPRHKKPRLWVEVCCTCEKALRYWIPWDDLAEPDRGWLPGWV